MSAATEFGLTPKLEARLDHGPLMNIREEASPDWPEIDALLHGAFGGDYECKLVSRLRSDEVVAVALVAEAEQQIIGHVVLSWLPTLVDARSVRAVALAPLAVRVDRQRRGVGSRLVEAAGKAGKQAGAEAVILLGHPSYYPRFGFSADLAAKLASPFSGPAFMALELVPGALSGAAGSVSYPPAFGL
jgi:putative acetyltransferase